MNLAFGIAFLFVSAWCFYLASHGIEASTPFAVFVSVLEKIREA